MSDSPNDLAERLRAQAHQHVEPCAHCEAADALDRLSALESSGEVTDDDTMADRDYAEEMLAKCADEAGCKEEWSNAHYHGDCIIDALEAAAKAEARVAELERIFAESSRGGMMTDKQRAALASQLRANSAIGLSADAAAQLEADGKRIAELEAMEERATAVRTFHGEDKYDPGFLTADYIITGNLHD